MGVGVVVARDITKATADEMRQAILAGLEEIGTDIEKIASEDAPVDTGRLSASITHALDTGEPSVQVGTNVPYAVYVHEGTSKMKGRPFLRNAATDNVDRISAIMKRRLGSI